MDNHDSARSLYEGIGKSLTKPGDSSSIRGPVLAHTPVTDTALAACLATLGVPLRHPHPFTDGAGINEAGSEISRTKCWWLGDASICGTYKTDEIRWAWIHRGQFEAGAQAPRSGPNAIPGPDHPLTWMRAAIDARGYWIGVIHAWRQGAALLPIEPPRPESNPTTWVTDSLIYASILKASGYQPLAFNNRGFFLTQFPAASKSVFRILPSTRAGALLAEAILPEGRTPPQWMARCLTNLSGMLKHVRNQGVTLIQTFDDETLLLSANATPKTRDRFFKLL